MQKCFQKQRIGLVSNRCVIAVRPTTNDDAQKVVLGIIKELWVQILPACHLGSRTRAGVLIENTGIQDHD